MKGDMLSKLQVQFNLSMSSSTFEGPFWDGGGDDNRPVVREGIQTSFQMSIFSSQLSRDNVVEEHLCQFADFVSPKNLYFAIWFEGKLSEDSKWISLLLHLKMMDLWESPILFRKEGFVGCLDVPKPHPPHSLRLPQSLPTNPMDTAFLCFLPLPEGLLFFINIWTYRFWHQKTRHCINGSDHHYWFHDISVPASDNNCCFHPWSFWSTFSYRNLNISHLLQPNQKGRSKYLPGLGWWGMAKA